jgi:hypothetical protein
MKSGRLYATAWRTSVTISGVLSFAIWDELSYEEIAVRWLAVVKDSQSLGAGTDTHKGCDAHRADSASFRATSP